MNLNIKGFQESKLNETSKDIADHFASNINNKRFAISDGVTRSFFPKYWSKILVEGYTETKLSIHDILPELQDKWYDTVEEIVESSETKWFTKSQFYKNEPALATFIGLEIIDNQWKVQYIGDSYLVFVSKSGQKHIFSSNSNPLVFDNYPDYLSSIGEKHKGLLRQSEYLELVEGKFYFMTDALAEWFFKQPENDWYNLFDDISESNFSDFVATNRKKNLLQDDDTTLMILEVLLND